jgi:hypothetical protein
MTPLALEPKVLTLANTLGVQAEDAVEGVRDYCAKRLQKLIRGVAGSIKNIRDLQRVVCEKLNFVVHEIWSDHDLQEVVNSYVATDSVFAYLPSDLNPNTYGVLIRLNRRIGKKYAWVAIVDCRGDKRHRRFFTVWHEIVHCMTAAEQYELPFHRTIIGNKPADPIERLVDIVAGDLGFFDPLFRPHLERQTSSRSAFTFEAVEEVREAFCPDASFEATLNACVARANTPVLFLKAGMILKSTEQAAVESLQTELFHVPVPRRQLRVISTIRNDGARELGLLIPAHFRIPKTSVIARVFSTDVRTTASSVAPEQLSSWTTSTGASLQPMRVNVVARKVGEEVFALLTPAGH